MEVLEPTQVIKTQENQEKSSEINEIGSFLQGFNNLKYLVDVETYYHNNIAHCIINPPNEISQIKSIPYVPFLYLKDLRRNNVFLYNDDEHEKNAAIEKYGITIEELRTENQPRLIDGFILKVSSTISYNNIISFLKDGGLDMWEKYELSEFSKLSFPVKLYSWYNEAFHKNIVKLLKGKKRFEAIEALTTEFYKYSNVNYDKAIIKWASDICDYLIKCIVKAYKWKHLFYSIKPVEQFFISTGCRLYKGYENYTDVHKLMFDIETTGLRYEYSRVFLIGLKDNKGNEVVIGAERENDDRAERDLIIKFFNYYSHLKPAVIAGYNSEKFDFEFLLGRAEKLGIKVEQIRTTLDSYEITDREGNRRYRRTIKRRQNSSVKFGGSTERYTSTHIWGIPVIDIHHAAKRNAAINSEIKNTKLKYICKFEKIAKPNRVYIDGDRIYKMHHENKIYVLNPQNSDYLVVPDQHHEQAKKLYDLQIERPKLSIPDYNDKRVNIISTIPEESLQWFKDKKETFSVNYKFMKGSDIVKNYLIDDLWETEQVDNLYNQSSFLLAKIIPTSYPRICTMGNAAIWNLIMTTWSYENGLAIPCPDKSEKFSGGLARCYKKGYSERIAKIDFKSMYPHNQLEFDIFPIFDITGVIKKLLNYLTTQRNEFKFLAGDKSPLPKAERNTYKVKQLPLKILNNSLFGALGSGIAFNWSDNVCAARITGTGRIQLRQAITWFMNFGFDPLLAVTDGINFTYPEKTVYDPEGNVIYNQPVPIEEAWKYDKYIGLEAIIEYFNDKVLNSEYIGVDLDGTWRSSLNLSRINYANLTEQTVDEKTGETVKPKIKLTGNTIKSKTMSEYIEDFIDKGLKLILNGNGEEFVEYYNEYLKKLYYKQIPLKKIATKKRIKKTISEYLNRGTDKNGKKKGKQAHMELLIQERFNALKKAYIELYGDEDVLTLSMNELYDKAGHLLPPEPEVDGIVYYVNIGVKKGQADSSLIDDGNGGEMLAVKLITQEDFENNPNLMGDYNAGKYVTAFNKRVKTILEGFKPEIRNQILKADPAKREYFDAEDLKLTNFVGDSYDESLILEEKELEFWNRTGYNPYVIWDGFKIPTPDALDDLKEYETIINSLNEQLKERNDKRVIKSVNDKLTNGDLLLVKNFKEYSLHQYKDNYLRFIKYLAKEMKEYDFIEGGLTKKTIELKKQYVSLFKNKFKIPQEVKLSTITKGLEMFEEFLNIELAILKKKSKKKKKDEEIEDELIFLEGGKIATPEDPVDGSIDE